MAHAHKVYDSDTHFIIDTVTREILNETSGKTILIQNDHNAERFTFRIPKLVEGHDMSKCNRIEIHYINVDAATREKSANVYESNDVQNYAENGEEFITFSWLISENATKYVGNLSFCIVFKCTTNEGDVDYRWHSAINSKISIASSINNIEEATEGYSDIIAQWKAELFEAGGNSVVNVNVARDEAIAAIKDEGNAQIQAIQNEGMLQVQNVKDTAQAIENSRNQIHVNYMNKAAVISGEIEGEAIVIKDSAKMPFSNLNVYGKSTQNKTNGYQLFNALGQQNNAFGTAEIAEKGRVITVTGAYYVSFPINLIAGENYYVDFKAETDDGNYGIRFEYADNSITETLTNPNSFIPEKDVVSVYLYSGTGEEKTVIYKDVQICKGDIALEWENYTGGVPAPNSDYPQTIESIENPEISVTNNNLIDLSCYSSATNYAALINVFDLSAIKKGKTYTLSVWIDSEVESKAYWNNATKVFGYLEFDVKTGLNRYTYTFIATADGELYENPVNVLNKYPMNDDKMMIATNAQIEEGEEATKYVPFDIQNLTIPHTLAGIPVTSGGNYTDADGRKWICDEIDFARGVYIQRIKNLTLNGTENWRISASYLYIDIDEHALKGSNGLCSHFRFWYNFGGDCIFATEKWIYLGTELTKKYNVDTWKEFLAKNNVSISYILAEPIEIALSDAEIEAFKALVSNYPNTTILNNSRANMKVGYGIDTKMYIDSKIEELRKSLLES